MNPMISKRKLAWRIRAIFEGKLPPKEYLTPNVWMENPRWGDEIFNRVIESLEFYLPTGHVIYMSGMEQYNFFVEAAQSKKTKGKAEILAFWLCGKLPGMNLVEMWRVGNGRVVRDRKPFGREWGGHATRGWKQGRPGRAFISRLAL